MTKTKILIISLCATMEDQLGNIAIFIPTIRMLKRFIPNVEISTTLELSKSFCDDYGITSINDRKVRGGGTSYSLIQRCFIVIGSLFDLLRCGLWKLVQKILRLNFKTLIRGKKLKKYNDADVIIDFSGDIYGDNTNVQRFVKHSLDILTARLLGKPVIMFAQSPGPFSTRLRLFLAKFVLNKVSLITTREPMSTALLQKIGIEKVPIITAACPAFFLESASKEKVEVVLSKENIDINKRPLIGVTLCGYNLRSNRTWDIPTSFSDLWSYVLMIKYLLDELKGNVLLIPHVYRTNKWTGEQIHGPDWLILRYLFQMVNGDIYGNKLKLVNGIYTTSEMKGLIGQCDLFISGRMHAGIAALSQGIPTVLLAYGHKHFGIARLLGQEEYVYGGTDPKEIVSIVKKAWENREEISEALQENLTEVKELVNLNFKIVKEIIKLDKEERDHISEEKVAAWVGTNS